MSAILDELIRAIREGVIAYEKMLDKYVELVRKSEEPENNTHYPEIIGEHATQRQGRYGLIYSLLRIHQSVLNILSSMNLFTLWKISITRGSFHWWIDICRCVEKSRRY